ncbi:nucleotide sugar dehydrogenase [Desulfoscipio geothermicus]|uniref:UDP-N-acetyl-D-glucosamine dehydrogenase n=1 Tax=Desulfoscipio geothermicus DSM 3669 TaxID=1121426 RepID=A0A1I6E3F3_9FIRM|nr:nucleotide sugar dehydrogenase [Desulfoscipio geothermicus]SFR12071.1 UDP-N-acetyl-D-glucosamine dehydrogenase [Desulfoscipio geothermicus DSM 3669]
MKDVDSIAALSLKEKIIQKKIVLAVIGLGYVGLPLALENAKSGFLVLGIDKDSDKVAQVNLGNSYIRDVRDSDLLQVVSRGRLSATTSFGVLERADVVIICVPTPLTATREPDLSYVTNAALEIAKRLHRGQLITLESTTYPGTTEQVVQPILEKTGLKVGRDLFLAFSPERVDPGNIKYTTKNTSKIVGGVTPACLDLACTFYSQTLQVVPVSSPAVAEITKLFENTYRAVNIALVNELMFLCDRMGIDVWEVVDAAGTKPFGIQTFYPGPGVGGHCIPIDPFYLSWKAKEYSYNTKFIEMAGEINAEATQHVFKKVYRVLNNRKKSINGSRILVIGVAYKKDIDDVRESPALRIIAMLLDEQADVVYHDPYVPSITLANSVSLKSIVLSEDEIKKADCMLILTDHSCLDYNWLTEHAAVIIDARNATKDVKTGREKIVKI